MTPRPNATMSLTTAAGKKQTYKLRFDLHALVLIEQALGESLQSLLSKPGNADFANSLFTANNIQAFLYAGLQHFHPELDQATVGRMIGLSDYANAVAAVAEGLTDALGGLPAEAEPKKKFRTGKPSKPSH